jgi:type II secretory pathway component GspD/PulD (secretin)
LEQIRRSIKTLDVEAPQVMIEAMIINVKLTDELKMGIDWNKLGTLDNYFSQDLSITGSTNPFGQINFSKVTGAWTLAGLLDFIQTYSDVKVLANPKVLVLNNHTATIEAVEEVPYRKLSETSGGGLIGTTSFKEAGIKLQVTPQITQDGQIIIHIRPEQSAQIGTFTIENSETPVIETRKAETTLRVEDGQTIIIGGLRKKQPTVEESKIPILGDIPLIGLLFRKVSTKQIESELAVFITPRIYTDGKLSDDELNLIGQSRKNESLFEAANLLRLPKSND